MERITWPAGDNAHLRGTRWRGWNFQSLAKVRVNQVISLDDDFTRFASAIDIAVVQIAGKSTVPRIAPLSTGSDEVVRTVTTNAATGVDCPSGFRNLPSRWD